MVDENTQTKAEGLLDEVSGKVKDAAGGLTGDIGLQAKGKIEQFGGQAQQEFADLYDEGESKLEMATAFVQDRPLLSLGVATLVGTLVGWLLFSRK
jgi:uncharacterized protein YjbJ (UPF0337 family)